MNNIVAPHLPKLPPLPLDFSLPVRSPTEPVLKYRLRICLRVVALALMTLAAVPAMLFAGISLTLHKWSRLDLNHTLDNNAQSGGNDG